MALLFLLAAALPAVAQSDGRAAIARERQVLNADFAAEERACRERFVVTPCVDDVRVRRRQALAPLRERELQLDDEQRRLRAQQRQATREARAAARRPASTPAAPRVAPASAPPREATQPRHAQDQTARAQQAAERSRAVIRRTQESQQAQADIARRVAERESSGKKAQPLPPPVVASGSLR